MTPESHGDPNATNYNTNGSTDRGLFQVNSIHAARVAYLDQLYDPATNVRVAAAIYSEQGWCPWATAAKLGLCR